MASHSKTYVSKDVHSQKNRLSPTDVVNLVPVKSNMTSPRGLLICVEGIDRSGKTTLCRNLARDFPHALHIRFPNRESESGKEINAYLTGQTSINYERLHELFCLNRQEEREKILNALYAGQDVIVDRYAFSGVVYSLVRLGHVREKHILKDDKDMPAPDMIVFLQLTPEEAATHGDYGKEVTETLPFQIRVSEEYAKLQEKFPQYYWMNFDATVPSVTLANQVSTLIKAWPRQLCRSNCKYLWK